MNVGRGFLGDTGGFLSRYVASVIIVITATATTVSIKHLPEDHANNGYYQNPSIPFHSDNLLTSITDRVRLVHSHDIFLQAAPKLPWS